MKKIFLIFLLVTSQTFCFATQSVISNIFIFGDSLSDMGSLIGAPFTNTPGTLWANVVAQYYNLPLTSSGPNDDLGGNNWAHTRETSATVVPRLNNFLALNPKFARNDLVIIWVGVDDIINDYISIWYEGMPVDSVVANAMQNINTVISSLIQAKAQKVLIMGVPRIDVTPYAIRLVAYYGTDIIPALQQVVTAFNTGLQTAVTAYPIRVKFFDTNYYIDQTLNNYQSYGFTNITGFYNACLNNCDPNNYFFWDYYHPTTAAHQILGNFVNNFIDQNF